MSAICEGRFNPDAPRSQYWPTAMPVCRTPRPADFQGPGVVPMTPKVNIEREVWLKKKLTFISKRSLKIRKFVWFLPQKF